MIALIPFMLAPVAPPPIGPAQDDVPVEVEQAEGSSDLLRELEDSVELYGSLRVRLSTVDGESEVENGSSRLGLRLRREVEEGFTLLGRTEWQLNLVESDTRLSLSESTGSALLESEDVEDAFQTRLGYVGADFGTHGTVTAGKQWGVYYDVSGWTDVFPVFGAEALGTFTAGTDGGLTGTGRAEQAIAYRVDVGGARVGAQIQLKGLTEDGSESAALSITAPIRDGLEVGIAVNSARLDDSVRDALGTSLDPLAVVAGFNWEGERWRVAAGVSWQDEHDAVLLPEDEFALVDDAVGVELYVRRAVGEKAGIYGGLNWLDPEVDDPRVDDDYGSESYYLGVDWVFSPGTFAYLQAAIEEGTSADGGDPDDALVAGLRYGF